MADKSKIPILLFADSILSIQPYDWQCKILMNYEAPGRAWSASRLNIFERRAKKDARIFWDLESSAGRTVARRERH